MNVGVLVVICLENWAHEGIGGYRMMWLLVIDSCCLFCIMLIINK